MLSVNLYRLKVSVGPFPVIVVDGPFDAVTERTGGPYVQCLAIGEGRGMRMAGAGE